MIGGSAGNGARRQLVIVGGGITGLAAAWEASADPDIDVTVLEASERVGGKIRTSALPMGDGTTMPVDEGADAFLARVPDAVELCRELGLSDELTQPAIGQALVLAAGELRTMPADTVLGVPLDPDQLEASGILSAEGVEAVRAERSSTAPAPDGDVTIGAYLAERFGPELVDNLVGPLIGGINAGDVNELSLRAVTPQLADAAEDGGPLSEALQRRRARAAGSSAGPVFHALVSGTGRLIEVLAERLVERGVQIRTSCPVRRIEPVAGGGHLLHLGDNEAGGTGTIRADAVVLATPAPAAARLLRDLSPVVARELSEVHHSSPVLVTLVYDRSSLDHPLDASGFLVPRHAGLFITAASFGSSKWAHWDDGRHVVLRVSVGHSHDNRADNMSDDEVVTAIRGDLQTVLGIVDPPMSTRVSRYPDGFAQYTVGHLDRVDRIEAALERDQPSIVVAGAAYRGVGIPACIRQGREAARKLVVQL